MPGTGLVSIEEATNDLCDGYPANCDTVEHYTFVNSDAFETMAMPSFDCDLYVNLT